MKVVYVGGPFRGATPWQVEQNVRKAEELAFEVWKLGAAALCPHTNTRFFDKSLPDKIFLDGTMELLKRCDAMILVRGWLARSSAGTSAELQWCLDNRRPVFEDLIQLNTWLTEGQAS